LSLSSSRSPRSSRDSTENAEQYGKGEVQEGIKAFRKDGGPENEGASKVTSSLRMEDVNERAYPKLQIGGQRRGAECWIR
jgi:hypothetical protein